MATGTDGVRQAGRSDADAIARINVAAWRASYRGIVPDAVLDGASVERRALAVEAHMARSEQVTWLLERGGEPAAYASVGPSRDADAEPTTGELYAVYVAPGHARQGFGTLLLERAEDSLRAGGYDRATLWVLAENEGARRFYERAGWRRDGHEKAVSWSGADLTVVRYARELRRA
jgi:ribosomal protein S18 acetylase RimI-like enzyme